MSFLAKFLPNELNRQLAPGFIAFCVAAVGAAVGFLAWATSVGWLGAVAYVITLSGVAGGFAFIVFGWVRVFFRK